VEDGLSDSGHPARPVYRVSPGETVTAWILSEVSEAYFPGQAAPGEDRVGYKFINGFVDVGDLPCRKAFWAEMVGRHIEPRLHWQPAALSLPGANRRVEFTGFWHVPTHVSRWLRGTFLADQPQEVSMRLRTCGGVRIWVNGREQVRFEPFLRNTESETDIVLVLKAGSNDILVLTEDLAERDTIWFFELELSGDSPLDIALPSVVDRGAARQLEPLARSIRPSADVFVNQPLEIIFDNPPDFDVPVHLEVYSHGHDRSILASVDLTLPAHQSTLLAETVTDLPDGYHGVRVKIGSGTAIVDRQIDAAFIGNLMPPKAAPSLAQRKQEALAFSARHGADRIGRVLAMAASGEVDEKAMERIIDATLASIDRREDCSDFSMVPLLWLLAAHEQMLPSSTAAKIRTSIAAYRYWVDEPGNDVMWFWSENHVLCFHTSQLIAGQLLPDTVFSASGRTGRQQAELATTRLHRWFDSVEADGLAEWNSAAYYPVDFIGLLALERWAEPEIAARARGQLDLIFRMIALHTLAGVPAGSQGRAYDKELRAGPLTELAPFARVAFGEGWLNGGVASLPMFCAGSYRPPRDLAQYAQLQGTRSIEARYSQGLEPAKLVLFKTPSSQLSTVVDHKTGRKGHQQHVLDIRLSGHPMARLWINHPGEDDPWGTQRPSYWAGNGILPRVMQYRDVALLIADTRGSRLPWTHAYLGRDGLDEVIVDNGWLLVRAGTGFAALHGTNGLQLIEHGPTASRELRSPGSVAGWAAIIGSGDAAAFQRFCEQIKGTEVRFDGSSRTLSLTPPGRAELVLSYSGDFTVGNQPRPFVHDQPQPIITYDSAAENQIDHPFYA
jgi:hypothetical protein